MAEMILKKYGGDRFLASSAGLSSYGYAPMTPGTRDELLSRGLGSDYIYTFVSRRISEADVAQSDIVVGVTELHAQALREKFPQYRDKITAFEYPVENVWETEESYRRCYDSIKKNVFSMFGIKDSCITVRAMDESGASNSVALDEECFSHPYTAEEMKKIAESFDHIAICAYYDYEYAGFATAYNVLDEGNVLDIAVVPKFRRQGVGETLLRELAKRMKKRGVAKLMLEVREQNAAARGLYEKFGFQIDGKRKNYYDSPQDDAVLYTLFLAEKDI